MGPRQYVALFATLAVLHEPGADPCQGGGAVYTVGSGLKSNYIGSVLYLTACKFLDNVCGGPGGAIHMSAIKNK